MTKKITYFDGASIELGFDEINEVLTGDWDGRDVVTAHFYDSNV